MVAAAAEPINVQESGKPNYGQIYIYLSSLLKGETPPVLPPLESSVVLTLIQDIVNKIRTSDLSGQMHYLSNWYKQSQSENDSNSKINDSGEKNRSKSDGSPTTSAVKRTSSGRIVRQRVDLTLYNNKGDEEDKEKEKNASQKKSETNISPKPRPTSLNPFRIPVTLLNFKDTRSTLVADKPNSSDPR